MFELREFLRILFSLLLNTVVFILILCLGSTSRMMIIIILEYLYRCNYYQDYSFSVLSSERGWHAVEASDKLLEHAGAL